MLLNYIHKYFKKKNSNNNLEQLAESIFTNWFVNCEPLKMKIL